MTTNDWSILAKYGVTPDSLDVEGSLWLFGCPSLTSQPDNLSVGGKI